MDDPSTSAIEDVKNASTFDDGTSSKVVTATADFLLRISNLYSEKAPFMAADCASKAFALNFLQSTKNDMKPLSKRFEKLQSSVCSRCKAFFVIGRNVSLSWRSTAAQLRRYGGEKRLTKIAQRRDSGIRVTKSQQKIYARYLKKKAMTNGLQPRLLITCTTCGFVSSALLSGSTNQKWSRDVSSSLIGQSSVDVSVTSSEVKKKRKRKRKDPNAGLNLSGKEKETVVESTLTEVQRIVATPRLTPKLLMTPVSSSVGQSKKKIKSRLDRLLAEEEGKKKNRGSFGNVSGLAGFLESLWTYWVLKKRLSTSLCTCKSLLAQPRWKRIKPILIYLGFVILKDSSWLSYAYW